jgi:hypothetical protein
MQTQTESAIELFEQGLTEKDIAQMVSNSIEHILETGEVLKVAEAISCMEHFIKGVKDDPRFKEYVREETSKYPKGFISNSGAKIECIESGVKYDYSGCGDIQWETMDAEMKGLKDRITEREKFLKNLPLEGIEVRHEDQLIHVYPPSKSSTSSFKITLAK